MNFNFGGPSNYSHESGDDEHELLNEIQSIDARIEVASQMYNNNNNILIATLIQQQQENQPIHGGSIPGHTVIRRDREAADAMLFEDYFGDNPPFTEGLFRRRFWMSKMLFLRILQAVEAHDNYFVQKKDAIGRLELSSLQKITSAFRVLAYGILADATNEYVKIGESTVVESVKRLCRAVVEVFGGRYLRAPNAEDIERLLRTGKEQGFPDMLGSLDCMHRRWKNCPTAWTCQYADLSGHPTIILEAVADYDLWIWHAHFGMPGSNNDINVLEASHLFANLAKGVAPPARYVIQGREYMMGYYLADDIYPSWATLVQTIRDPRGPKKNTLP